MELAQNSSSEQNLFQKFFVVQICTFKSFIREIVIFVIYVNDFTRKRFTLLNIKTIPGKKQLEESKKDFAIKRPWSFSIFKVEITSTF